MGLNKIRRPFIWQDEMNEVRELFRRVDRVKRGGFTGFSTWDNEVPSADTLSRNRLRRRRAQFAVELSHLNYREAPFEALTHLQHIRGMCTRIQRQESTTERKKKDVDILRRPPLLRRPVTSTSIRKPIRGRTPFEHGRPYSAPMPDIGQIPLQYAPPKLTALYDITKHRRTSSRSSRRSMNNVGSERPASRSSCRLHGRTTGGYESPAPGGFSNRSSPHLQKHIFTDDGYGQSSSRPASKASESCTGCSILRATPLATQRVKRSTTEMRCAMPDCRLVDRLPLERMKLERACARIEKLSPAMRIHEQPTSSSTDDITSSDFDSSSVSRSLLSTDSSRGAISKGARSRLPSRKTPEKPSFILPVTAYESMPERALVSVLQSPLSPFRFQPKEKIMNHLMPRELPFPSPIQLKRVDSDDLSTLNQRVKFASPARMTSETQKPNIDVHIRRETLNESPWSTESNPRATVLMEFERVEIAHKEMLPNTLPGGQLRLQNTDSGVASVDDSHVLIKHSSDPYQDFRNSMWSMIQEERLQDRPAGEMEELFQYYLDLNPAVHHEVLKRVINDIRRELTSGAL